MEGLIILVLLALAAIPVILPIVSLVMASRTRARLQALEEATARLQDELNTLTTQVRQARTAPVGTPEAAAPETGTSRVPAPVPRQAPLPAAPPLATPPLAAGVPPAGVPLRRGSGRRGSGRRSAGRAASRPQAAGGTPASPRDPPSAPVRESGATRRTAGLGARRRRHAERAGARRSIPPRRRAAAPAPRPHPAARSALPRPPRRLDRRNRPGSTGRAWWACASSRRWRASRW